MIGYLQTMKRRQDELLYTTKLAAMAYFEADNLVEKFRTVAKKEFEALIQGNAETEWGENTACTFSEDYIIVENFDGRLECLRRKELEKEIKEWQLKEPWGTP